MKGPDRSRSTRPHGGASEGDLIERRLRRLMQNGLMRIFSCRMVWALGLSLSAMSMHPGSAGAQADALPPSLDSIGPGCCVLRVRQSGQQAQGRFQGRPNSESVLLRPCSGPLCGALAGQAHTIQLSPDAFIEMRSGTQAGKGLVFGSVSGAGLVLGLVFIGGCDDCDASASDYALLGIIGAAGGGAIGALLGAFIPNWIPVRH